MGRNLQTIYEYFNNYSEKEIDYIIEKLSSEDQELINLRYGDDLNNPKTSENWDNSLSRKFYNTLIPKMKKMLKLKEESIFESEFDSDIYKLLDLIKENETSSDICQILNIDHNKLNEILLTLKNKGLTFLKKYYSDGSITYNKVTKSKVLENLKFINDEEVIITRPDEKKLKVLAISDLHFGNANERIDLIDRAYNYCTKNGIHIILCCGDFIDGKQAKSRQKISDLYRQIDYFIKKYPYDKSIITFGIGGNHDVQALNKEGLDIVQICQNYRNDIVIGGYDNFNVNIKNDNIKLYHYIDKNDIKKDDSPIILYGHSHHYCVENIENSLAICIPSLCEVIQPMPSVLELELCFEKGYITTTNIKHVYFGEKDIILSTNIHNFSRKEIDDVQLDLIKNEESPKRMAKTHSSLSRIDKFNKKYGYR